MVFTDPPYNVAIANNVCGRGKVKHNDFEMASGELSEIDFTKFLETAFTHMGEYSHDGSFHFICMDWRHMAEVLNAGKAVYAELKNRCVWNKTNAGMGSLYRSKHEDIYVFKYGTAPHVNNIQLGKYGRNRTNVWDYPGINAFGKDRDKELAMHPTVKPVALVADASLDCSDRGNIVLDTFAGSGTTIIAAERTKRKAYCMELDPRYVDTAIRRFEDYTGVSAIHAETGKTFAAMAKLRTAPRNQKKETHHETLGEDDV